jgi:hypothetical protein
MVGKVGVVVPKHHTMKAYRDYGGKALGVLPAQIVESG